MRRIKTYVITLGVALSVTPIFNYALAQQGNNSTQLLLQVQTMRQEIAELRDMVERQQFQLKRLQKQADAQSNLPGAQGFDNRLPAGNSNQPNYNAPLAQGGAFIEQTGNLPQANTGSIANTGVAAEQNQQTSWDVAQAQDADGVYRTNTPNQVNSQGVVSAANQNAYADTTSGPVTGRVGSQSSNYPPVVDRSFSTSASAVPITGAGTRQPSSSGIQDGAFQEAPNSQVPASTGNQQTFNQQTSNQQYQTPQTASDLPTNGVISIPSQAGAVVSQAPIDASQIPAQAIPGQVASVQNAATAESASATNVTSVSSAPESAVVSEDDYYAQGFELLKQSKYEEAATIFEQQLQAFPRGDLADDAHYWIAEAMHVSRKLDVAKVHLKAIINDYPQSRRLPDAMLKTAYIEQSQGNQIEARILFQEIVSQHPQSDAAIAAKNQLAAIN